MLDVVISAPDLARWRAMLGEVETGRYFKPALAELLPQIGERVKARAKANVAKASGTLAGAIDYETGPESVRVGILRSAPSPGSGTSTLDYGYYMEKGPFAQRAPPPAALHAWMQRVGYTGSDYLLSKTIGEKGATPTPFLAPALRQAQPEIVQLARIAYQNALNQFQSRAGAGLLSRITAWFRGLLG